MNHGRIININKLQGGTRQEMAAVYEIIEAAIQCWRDHGYLPEDTSWSAEVKEIGGRTVYAIGVAAVGPGPPGEPPTLFSATSVATDLKQVVSSLTDSILAARHT